jgi:hypothetical protein
MRLRGLVVSLGVAAFAGSVVVSGCKEKPAATIKEVNTLDEKSTAAPKPVEDPRFQDFFDHVRART